MSLHKLDTQMYVGQKAFINRNGTLLVLRDVEDNKGLDFPGGKYRWRGDLLDELKREVFEETRLDIKIGQPFITWTAIRGGGKVNTFLVGYLCEYVSGEVKLSDEHDKFEWVDKKSYKNWQENTSYFKALKQYFELQSQIR